MKYHEVFYNTDIQNFASLRLSEKQKHNEVLIYINRIGIDPWGLFSIKI